MYDLLDKNGVKHLWSLITEAINQVAANIPTKVSELLNDSEYQTEEEVRQAITDALSSFVGIDYEVVETLPETGEKGIIYLMPESYNEDGSVKTYYEYIWLEGHWERLGTTDIDLTNYATKDYVDQAIADNPGYKVYHLTNPGLNSEVYEYDFVEGDKETLTQIFNSIKNEEEFQVIVERHVEGEDERWGTEEGAVVHWNLNNEYNWDEEPPVLSGYRLYLEWQRNTYEYYSMSTNLDLEGNVTSEKWNGNYSYSTPNAWSVQYNYYDYDTSDNIDTSVARQLDIFREQVKTIKQPDYKTIVTDDDGKLKTVTGGSKDFTNTIYYGLIGGTSKKGTYLSSEGVQYYLFGTYYDYRTIIGEYTNPYLARQALQNKNFYVCVEVDGEYRTAQGRVNGYEWQLNITDTSEGSIKYFSLDTGYATIQLYQASEDTTHVITGLWISDTPFEEEYTPIGKEYVPVDNKTIEVGDDGIETVIGGYKTEEERGDQMVLYAVDSFDSINHSADSSDRAAVSQYLFNPHEPTFILADDYESMDICYVKVAWGSGRVNEQRLVFNPQNIEQYFWSTPYGQEHEIDNLANVQIARNYGSKSFRVVIYKDPNTNWQDEWANSTDWVKSIEVRTEPWETVYHPIDPTYIPVDGTTIEVENGKLKANVPDIDMSSYATQEELAAVEDQIPSIEGLATTEQVNEATAAVEDKIVPSQALRTLFNWWGTLSVRTPFQEFGETNINRVTPIEVDNLDDALTYLKKGYLVNPTTQFDWDTSQRTWQYVCSSTYQADGRTAIQVLRYDQVSTWLRQMTPSGTYLLTDDTLWVFRRSNGNVLATFAALLPYKYSPQYGGQVTIVEKIDVLDTNKADKTEIPDVSNFATKDELAAVEGEIPSIEGLATTEQVNRKQDKLANGSTENNALVWDADSESWVPGVIESGSSYPEPPAANGNYQLLAIVNNGEVEYSWVTLSGVWQYPLQTGNNLALYQGSVINQYNNNLEII